MPALKTKISREERLERKRVAERIRKAEKKSDPKLREELKQKDRDRYWKNKSEGKIKTMRELPPEEQEIKREKSRVSSNKHYNKKKQKKGPKTGSIRDTQDTPAQSTTDLPTDSMIVTQDLSDVGDMLETSPTQAYHNINQTNSLGLGTASLSAPIDTVIIESTENNPQDSPKSAPKNYRQEMSSEVKMLLNGRIGQIIFMRSCALEHKYKIGQDVMYLQTKNEIKLLQATSNITEPLDSSSRIHQDGKKPNKYISAELKTAFIPQKRIEIKKQKQSTLSRLQERVQGKRRKTVGETKAKSARSNKDKNTINNSKIEKDSSDVIITTDERQYEKENNCEKDIPILLNGSYTETCTPNLFVKNTCAFDSVCYLLANACTQGFKFSTNLLRSENTICNFVRNMVENESTTRDLYNQRAHLVKDFYNNVETGGRTVEVNCESSVTDVFERLLINVIRSADVIESCTSDNCGIKSVSRKLSFLSLSTNTDISKLNDSASDMLNTESYMVVCRRNGCIGLRTFEKHLQEIVLFECSQTDAVLIKNIPLQITLKSMVYHIIGVLEFVPPNLNRCSSQSPDRKSIGHYRAHFNKNCTWMVYDDLKPKLNKSEESIIAHCLLYGQR